MATFALVFGAGHGPWCWSALIPELHARGHEAIAPDFACDDPALGACDYAQAVVDALASVEEEAVVVGHSLAGLTIPLVAELRPVTHLIFLCAVLPQPGTSLNEQTSADRSIWAPTPPGGEVIDPLYNRCPPDVAAAARRRLRPQASTPFSETTPVRVWPPAVPCTSIVATHDLIVNPAWSRAAAHERLGVAPIEIDTDHSPFLSAPKLLADVLVRVVEMSPHNANGPPEGGPY